MKKGQIVIVMRKRTGRWAVSRDLSAEPEILKDQLEIRIVSDHGIAQHLILSHNREHLKTKKAMAENRSIFYIEEGIEFDRAHEFYKNAL